jgi:predicted ATPase
MRGSLQQGMAQVREGMATREVSRARCFFSATIGALALAQSMSGQPHEGLATLDELFSWIDESDERFFEAELYRLYGEFQLLDGYISAAEVSLWKAIEVARRQHARSFELRAATDLADLMLKQERRAEAHSLLQGIYSWFTEGFDTPDLLAAKALLDELN